MDLVYVGAIAVFFVVLAAFAAACEKLGGVK